MTQLKRCVHNVYFKDHERNMHMYKAQVLKFTANWAHKFCFDNEIINFSICSIKWEYV